uniref:HpcH/HpaI aldolase/citrate lyase domain-containing protein n=1 Tax=Kalanchoe fedtschenkoi TaxID=63787 RepID=A0A7N0UV38_KALFE
MAATAASFSASFSTHAKRHPETPPPFANSITGNAMKKFRSLKLPSSSSSSSSSRSTAAIMASKHKNASSDLSVTHPNPSTKTLKSRLRDGETLYGLFLLSFSPTLAEIAGLAGYDFVVVDMEHGPGGITDALHCLHALAASGTSAILRLPECCPTWAKKALDLGPQGIMFPMIDTPKLAKKAVSYCRFPPAGIRGSAHTVVRASSYGIDAGYLSNYEDELLIMCQIESEEGVKKVDEIAAVEGVDCIQMGPLDLSASMGYLWDPGNKKVREMMKTAEKAVLNSRSGKKDDESATGAFLAGFAMPHDAPIDMRRRGYHMVSGAVDVGLFRSAAVEDVKKFKMNLDEEFSDDEEDNAEGKNGKDGDEKYWSE